MGSIAGLVGSNCQQSLPARELTAKSKCEVRGKYLTAGGKFASCQHILTELDDPYNGYTEDRAHVVYVTRGKGKISYSMLVTSSLSLWSQFILFS